MTREKETARSSSAHQHFDEANPSSPSAEATGLAQILGELQEFRKDMKQQLHDIKTELVNVHQKMKETEDRVEAVEERVQNMEQILGKMIELVSQQQEKLLEQEGRSRRENIRICNVPEGAEGSAMRDFVEKLLKDTLEIDPNTELDIERAHQALAPPPAGGKNIRLLLLYFSAAEQRKRYYEKHGERKECFYMVNLYILTMTTPPCYKTQRIHRSYMCPAAEKD